ncbi:uncharacterized protein N7473_004306 [Penicillium subrubescens]|uniref:uncharacterized protein n=1 Tax=Penicillium subrubescens TaxID=1316194 RepID=UPI0025456483|nr:uncharacterized protein N7473_004306 [Penicillium subrubescens]KAJ5900236.1 hypothetical protein N7473_004306 [Penicillium subrubescens]
MMFKGLKIYKADPIPGNEYSWSRVECTEMVLTQRELYSMVDKRADQISAAKQYQRLPEALRALINHVLGELKERDVGVEWSCAYIENRGSSSKCPCDCQKRESLVLILMKRPRNRGPWLRTPMGDLIDFGSRRRYFAKQDDLSETPSFDLQMDATDGEESSPSEV